MAGLRNLPRPRRRATAARAGALALALGAGLLSGTAEACNKLTLKDLTTQTWQGASGTGYEVFQPSSNPQSVTFTVRKNGPSGCSYFVAVTVGGSGSFNRKLAQGGTTLNYNIYDSLGLSAVIKDLPTASGGEIVVGSFSGGGNQENTHTVYFNIPAEQAVAPATYTDTVQFKAYLGSLASPSLDDTQSVTLQAPVAQVAELSIVDAGGGFDLASQVKTIDFGVLTANLKRSVDILVRSNSGYDVSLQSENAGVMRITDPSDGSTVSYTLTVNGGLVDLASGAAVNAAGANGLTTSAGARLRTEVTIGAIGDASAGNYRDAITIVVAAR